jgi:hypothetical protein
MNDEERALKILGDMRDNKQLLYTLYARFASIFPEHHDFWQEISVEKNTHALMLDAFISLYKSQHMALTERSFAITEIQEERERIKNFVKRLDEGAEITLAFALEFALQTENAMIEKEVFKYHDPDPEDFKKMAQILIADSKRYYRKINRLSESIRRV